ncbi:MAG: hypothetical protein OXN91_00925 [Chloroflexota bacterium]|nr:hypothetical protein [Chloroflexota bacterium]
MTRTLDDFCDSLVNQGPDQWRPTPAALADAFVRYFRLSGRPTLDEVTRVLRDAGIAAVVATHLPGGLRGFHCGLAPGAYAIHYSTDQWTGAWEHTVLHETYEIIYEMLQDRAADPAPNRHLCREADQFAAAVLMQPAAFTRLAVATGLDVLALRRRYRRSYASVTLRLAEVLRQQPLLAVLYERRESGVPAAWTERPAAGAFRATVVARTPGFGARNAGLLCGTRGGMPRRGRPPAVDALVARVVRSGRASYAEEEPAGNNLGTGDVAVVVRPVVWHRRLAKIALVAVPYRDRSALRPQLDRADVDLPNGRTLVTAPHERTSA